MKCFDVDAHAGRRVRVRLWTRSYVPLRTLNLTRTGEHQYIPTDCNDNIDLSPLNSHEVEFIPDWSITGKVRNYTR